MSRRPEHQDAFAGGFHGHAAFAQPFIGDCVCPWSLASPRCFRHRWQQVVMMDFVLSGIVPHVVVDSE